MRIFLLILFFLSCLSTKAQWIDTVIVSQGNPNITARVRGSMPNIRLSKIQINSLLDNQNTLEVFIHFNECHPANIILFYDTTFIIPAIFPFDLKIKTIRDTLYSCGYPLEPMLMDSFFMRYSQLVDIQDIDIQNSVSLFPNPLKEKVVINFLGLEGEKRLQIMDINGRKRGDEFQTFDSTTSLNLSSLKLGIYILQVNTEKGILTRRLSVLK